MLDCLLAAAQGVTNYGLEMGETMHLVQDAAAVAACRDLCQEYLARKGHHDVFTSVTLLHWMSAWPQDEAQAAALISYGGTLAAISGAASVTTKSTHEAFGIPTPQANAEGLRMTRTAIYLARDIRLDGLPAYEQERSVIAREVRAIVDKVLEMGEGDAAVGTVRAFEAGVMDVPWSPNRHCRSRVLPARDVDGMLRILDPGLMPFPARHARTARGASAQAGRARPHRLWPRSRGAERVRDVGADRPAVARPVDVMTAARSFERIDVHRLRVPLVTPYRLAFGPVEHFDTIVVEITDREGHVGLGEATVLTGYTDETIDGSWARGTRARRIARRGWTQRTRCSGSSPLGREFPFTATAFGTAIEMLGESPLLEVSAAHAGAAPRAAAWRGRSGHRARVRCLAGRRISHDQGQGRLRRRT